MFEILLVVILNFFASTAYNSNTGSEEVAIGNTEAKVNDVYK